MLHFDTLPDIQSASKVIADRLHEELAGHKTVLWLLSGGSNIGIEIAALNTLPAALQTNLTISLNDERFGPFGHKDSNMQQLRDAGLSGIYAKLLPVIVPESLPLDATAMHFEENIKRAFATTDVIISQLGMGSDGHIAGILPNSPAVDAMGLVTSYTTEQYVRVTLTFEALKHVHTAYLFAFGQDKRKQLELLYGDDLPLREQPVQFLKQIPEAYVYNDQIDTASGDIKGENE